MLKQIIIFSLTLLASASWSQAAEVNDLHCEYQRDPLGIDVLKPRLSWKINSVLRGERQTAYQLLVASSRESLSRNLGDCWDSGKVSSDESLHVEYAGQALTSRLQRFWKVRVWDRNNQPSDWSAAAQWAMGLLDAGDWKAQWIAASPDDPSASSSARLGYHAAEASAADQTKWVQVDLGKPVVVSAVTLHSMYHDGQPGFGFPIRFTVSASNDPTFATFTLIADQSQNDYPNPGHRAVRFEAKAVTARYIRVTATRLWNRVTGPRPFCFALAELEVFSGDKNLAIHAPVTAQDSVEDFGWGKDQLTDGQNLAPQGNQAATAYTSRSLPIFRRAFQATKPVARAVLYACGLGQAEFRLNGHKIGNDLLQPGWTNYRKSCLYQTYDVTDAIRPGPNALGVLLGNGMYNVAPGRYTKFTGSFGSPKLIAQLEIDYADGTRDFVATDSHWKLAPGPITFSSIYGGEDYDARLDPPGWDMPAFDDSSWSIAGITQGPGGRLVGVSEAAPPIRVMKTLIPVKKTRLKPGVWLYDLGQNCSLLPRITLSGPSGTRVTIETGEKFEGDHFVGACDRLASFNYVLRGNGDETWSPRFTYVGARWLMVEGAEDSSHTVDASTPILKSIEGEFVCSSSTPAGDFVCSNDLFNRTAGIIDWAMRSNMMSILTDCPHRERLGWLEQIHLAGPSLMYRYDLAALLSKMTQDMAEAQLPNGLVPDIAPEYVTFDGGFRDSPEWGSAYVLVPWQVYQFYGDVSLLRKHYDGMRRYVAYLDSTAHDHIVDHGLADWYALASTPTPQVATALYYLDLTVLEKTARLLGKSEDARQYGLQADDVRRAYNARFYEPIKRSYATGTQTANALPVVLGIVAPADRAAVVGAIVRDIHARGNALTAGDVGYRYLLRALADNGRSDVVFDMNLGADHPGYGMILAKGNTSLPEPWDGGNQASSNHFMLGHIMEWFYADLAGIRHDPLEPGFHRIIIKPTPVGDVTWVNAHYDCGYGRITSNWKRDRDQLTMEVTIPANTTATVFVPGGDPKSVMESGVPASRAEHVTFLRMDGAAAIYEVGSGTYRFTTH